MNILWKSRKILGKHDEYFIYWKIEKKKKFIFASTGWGFFPSPTEMERKFFLARIKSWFFPWGQGQRFLFISERGWIGDKDWNPLQGLGRGLISLSRPFTLPSLSQTLYPKNHNHTIIFSIQNMNAHVHVLTH